MLADDPAFMFPLVKVKVPVDPTATVKVPIAGPYAGLDVVGFGVEVVGIKGLVVTPVVATVGSVIPTDVGKPLDKSVLLIIASAHE